MPGVHLSGDVTWSATTNGHLAATRQRCTCSAWALSWARCPSCRFVLARCGDHGGSRTVLELRAGHCRRPR